MRASISWAYSGGYFGPASSLPSGSLSLCVSGLVHQVFQFPSFKRERSSAGALSSTERPDMDRAVPIRSDNTKNELHIPAEGVEKNDCPFSFGADHGMASEF
jgi:hypothetical protein